MEITKARLTFSDITGIKFGYGGDSESSRAGKQHENSIREDKEFLRKWGLREMVKRNYVAGSLFGPVVIAAMPDFLFIDRRARQSRGIEIKLRDWIDEKDLFQALFDKNAQRNDKLLGGTDFELFFCLGTQRRMVKVDLEGGEWLVNDFNNLCTAACGYLGLARELTRQFKSSQMLLFQSNLPSLNQQEFRLHFDMAYQEITKKGYELLELR